MYYIKNHGPNKRLTCLPKDIPKDRKMVLVTEKPSNH